MLARRLLASHLTGLRGRPFHVKNISHSSTITNNTSTTNTTNTTNTLRLGRITRPRLQHTPTRHLTNTATATKEEEIKLNPNEGSPHEEQLAHRGIYEPYYMTFFVISISLALSYCVLFRFLFIFFNKFHSFPFKLEQKSDAATPLQGLRPIYLDHQATTPVDPRVLDAMLPFFTSTYGNPHSRTHAYGWESEKAVEKAREVN